MDLFNDGAFTLAPIGRLELERALDHAFTGIPLASLVSMITNRYAETVEYVNLCRGEKTCQKTSLLFNPHRLDTIAGDSKQTIYTALNSGKLSSGLARATLFKNGLYSELLYQVLQLGINGVQYVNEFPPHVMRDLLVGYGATGAWAVFDPCAGWGGRMIGASAVCNSYTAYEPETRTHAGLDELALFISDMRPDFSATIRNIPYEDETDYSRLYDIAVTSPPYYDTETYSEEPTNSANRYGTFQDWRESFYYPLIQNTMKRLRVGAPFVLNIGSRKYPLAESLHSEFGQRYNIRELGNRLSGKSGMGKSANTGEQFFEIRAIG